ncbi:MAG: acyltransferase [Candidatus Nanopelagicaceae bacterium]|nr:acyltransferase [Candidatus Nanopelagicaceae bacterium]
MSPVSSKSARLDYLDLLRVLALGYVICFHYLFSGIAKGNIDSVSLSSLTPFAKYGYLGVELFFMISGFVILYSTNRTAGEFIRRRFLRLFPMFWMALTLTYVISLMPWWERPSPTFTKFLWNLTMIPTAFGQERIDAAHWYLVRELQFYLFVAFVMWIGKAKLLPKIFPVWAIILCLWNLFNFSDFNIWYFSGYFSLITGGAIIYSIREWGWTPLRVIGLIAAYVGSIDTRISIIPVLESRRDTDYSATVITVVVTAIFLIMLLTLTNKISNFRLTGIGVAGAITYPLYLIHGRLGGTLIQQFANDQNKWFVYPLIVLFFIAFAFWLLKLEKRVLNWKPFKAIANR